jgi:hypothetical protein
MIDGAGQPSRYARVAAPIMKAHRSWSRRWSSRIAMRRCSSLASGGNQREALNLDMFLVRPWPSHLWAIRPFAKWGNTCYKYDMQIAKNNQTKTQGHNNFNVENHGRRLANLHCIQECLHNARISQMQVISYSDLQEAYITVKLANTRPRSAGLYL